MIQSDEVKNINNHRLTSQILQCGQLFLMTVKHFSQTYVKRMSQISNSFYFDIRVGYLTDFDATSETEQIK